jgi:DNA-binding response OmpR family regulator
VIEEVRVSDLNILIAEDDSALADLWQAAFRKSGYEVVIANNGQEAIDWLQANPLPDVLIVDYNMPLANGATVLKELAQLDPDSTVTTIMVTANHFVQTDEIDNQIDMFLVNPVGFREMKTLVERLAHRQ